METRSKRRRLMSSYSSWPDVPATFESLNDDTLATVLEFVGNKSYRSFGGLTKHCKEIYLKTKGMTKETFLFGYAPLSVIINKIEGFRRFRRFKWKLYKAVGKGVVYYNRRDVLAWTLQQRDDRSLRGICYVAAEEGRIDLLDEVYNKEDIEDDKEDMFERVDIYAARHGKLNVLKWLESKGLSFNKFLCAMSAAYRGHLHFIQWLREEKGVELDGGFYDQAIEGDHLHVMKWLKENEVDWVSFTFYRAALRGNLDVLQWLHDEGCPWPDDSWHLVSEEDLKSEVIDWCLSNGYGSRLVK